MEIGFELRNGTLRFAPLDVEGFENEAVFDMYSPHGRNLGITCTNITKERARELAKALLEWASE